MLCNQSRSQEADSVCTGEGPRQLVECIYHLVSFGPENPPDWKAVEALFAEDALIVLRTGKGTSTKFTVEEFILDFQKFAKNEKVIAHGFSERIVGIQETVFGDIAHFLVVYEAGIQSTDFRPRRGIDSFHLIKQDSVWKILSIINELPGPDNPLPEEWITQP